MLLYAIAFVASSAVIVAAGSALTRGADDIAERSGIGRAWIGAVALAAATSLPELTTDIAAVRMAAPNLAAGDLFGSSLANMLALAVIDQLSRRGSVLRGAAMENALIACLAIVLNALGVLFVLTRAQWTLFGITPASALLLLVYLGGTRAIYRNGVRQVESAREAATRPKATTATSFRRTTFGFVGATLAIFAAAPVLAWSARYIADLSGLGTTFVGTWLLGLATSLPEFVTSFIAVRMGAFDLAVGNLFGSNSFNMVIFVTLDLASPAGSSIFGSLGTGNAVAGTLAVVLMGLGLASILYRAERRFVMVEPDSVLMIAAYILAIWVMYGQSGVR
jgi:cation:H+ antiporter